jgi:hypothetical protein
MNIIGISQRVRVHNTANVPDRHYFYGLSRNMPEERRHRDRPGAATRNHTGEYRAVAAKSFNPSTPGYSINSGQPEGRNGNP